MSGRGINHSERQSLDVAAPLSSPFVSYLFPIFHQHHLFHCNISMTIRGVVLVGWDAFAVGLFGKNCQLTFIGCQTYVEPDVEFVEFIHLTKL